MPKHCPPICRQEVQSAAHVVTPDYSGSAPALALGLALLALAALAWFRQRSRRIPA